MGKAKTESRLKPNQATATAKFIRVPPRKARLVMDAVRGKYVPDALATLKFVPNFAARAIEKVIGSAVANAENGRPFDANGRPLPALVAENLKLVSGRVDEGPRLKRVQPRAQGRAYRILKRMCHISVIVEEAEPKPRRERRQAASRRARAAGRTGAAAAAPTTGRAKPQTTPPEPPETEPEVTAPETGAAANAPAPEAETE
ncbi:MAG: 50S ribosomal protein L22 [Chthonomonadales bacterium]|nr:50S ribosomal protein L22 [Chthonomonadales bacterium]